MPSSTHIGDISPYRMTWFWLSYSMYQQFLKTREWVIDLYMPFYHYSFTFQHLDGLLKHRFLGLNPKLLIKSVLLSLIHI